MEIIRGKHTSFLDASAFAEQLVVYDNVHVDLGTGDGHFVRHAAEMYPNCLVVGIDTCRENLYEVSRRALPNMLFVIANAQSLPPALCGIATHITVNFPWGSLLEGLLTNESTILAGLAMMGRSNASVEVRLNGEALTKAGWTLEQGTSQVRQALVRNGYSMHTSSALSIGELRLCPTTWAKRLAFGRDPRGVHLCGTRKPSTTASAAQRVQAGLMG